MGLFGAKDMSGYWSAGRGAICCGWLSQLFPQLSSERIFVPPVYSFKIDHLSILLKENGRKARFSPMSIALAHYIRLYVTCNAPCSRNIYCRKVFRDSVQISALFVFTSSKCRRPGVAVQSFGKGGTGGTGREGGTGEGTEGRDGRKGREAQTGRKDRTEARKIFDRKIFLHIIILLF